MMTTSEREQFLAERQQGIGGSDCASLFSIGWGCRRRLWYQKTNHAPDFPRDESDLMALGNILEPFFLDKYRFETARAVESSRTMFTKGKLLVHPDALINGHFPLSIKSCGRFAFSKYKREGLPEDYILQLQQEMLVLGAEWGSFAIGCRDDGRLLHWDVDADPGIQEQIDQKSRDFWPPRPETLPMRLSPEDQRCQACEYRTTCQGTNLIHIGEKQGDYERDDSLAALVLERQRAAAIAKEAADLFDDATEALKEACGDRTMLLAAGHKIQYYSQNVKEYTVPARTQRPLRVYPPKRST
jgi:YqaJ-like viral recombinase domain